MANLLSAAERTARAELRLTIAGEGFRKGPMHVTNAYSVLKLIQKPAPISPTWAQTFHNREEANDLEILEDGQSTWTSSKIAETIEEFYEKHLESCSKPAERSYVVQVKFFRLKDEDWWMNGGRGIKKLTDDQFKELSKILPDTAAATRKIDEKYWKDRGPAPVPGPSNDRTDSSTSSQAPRRSSSTSRPPSRSDSTATTLVAESIRSVKTTTSSSSSGSRPPTTANRTPIQQTRVEPSGQYPQTTKPESREPKGEKSINFDGIVCDILFPCLACVGKTICVVSGFGQGSARRG